MYTVRTLGNRVLCHDPPASGALLLQKPKKMSLDDLKKTILGRNSASAANPTAAAPTQAKPDEPRCVSIYIVVSCNRSGCGTIVRWCARRWLDAYLSITPFSSAETGGMECSPIHIIPSAQAKSLTKYY